MSVRKTTTGWRVDVEPIKGKRYRKTFKTKAEAVRYESHIRSQHAVSNAWNPIQDDKRRLSELIEQWYQHHGQHLAGAKPRKQALLRMCKSLANPIARQLQPKQFLAYRQARATKGIAPKTLNNELGYLNALYGYLYKTEQISYPSPLIKVQPIRIKERELSYLTQARMEELLGLCRDSGSKSLLMIVSVCLATGCRWNEAQTLTIHQIGHQRITFTNTKSGKNRTVPIPPSLEEALRQYPPTGKGRLFAKAIKSFYLVLDKCSFELPKGQAAHVLRHTYASHFIMNGGDILTLQKILGHSTVALTMRYAHLSPGHLQDAVKYLPAFDTFSTKQIAESKNP